MLDLVPFAGARWEMAYPNCDASVISQLLQLHLPQTQPVAVTATAIGRDQEGLRLRIESSSLDAPPAANGCHREGPGVVVRPDVHEPRVAPQVIDAIRIARGTEGEGKS